MSNIFAGKKSAAADKVEEDFMGGGGALDTDIYTATIKTAYIGKASASEARNVTLLLDVNGREVRQQIWVSNRNGDVTYKDKRRGKEQTKQGKLKAARSSEAMGVYVDQSMFAARKKTKRMMKAKVKGKGKGKGAGAGAGSGKGMMVDMNEFLA